jgi:regulator of protease activity HflC (stomatin/prohibitin superfamily)
MMDIVEQLRSWERGAAMRPTLYDEAADEIERLRATVSDMHRDAEVRADERWKMIDERDERIERLRAENERLTERTCSMLDLPCEDHSGDRNVSEVLMIQVSELVRLRSIIERARNVGNEGGGRAVARLLDMRAILDEVDEEDE